MTTLIESVEHGSQALMLLSWKGTLLASVVGLVLLLLHRHLSPAWRHGLWLLVMLRFMVPDLGHFSLSLDGLTDVPAMLEPTPLPSTVVEEVSAVEASVVEAPSASNAQPLPEMMRVVTTSVPPSVIVAETQSWSLRQKLTFLWLCGVVAVFGVMLVLHLRLLRRIRKDASEAFLEVSAVLDEACRLADLRTAPRLLVTDAVSAPSLFGILRPVILLPRQVAAGRDAAALKLILLHELAHLKRRDLWAQILSSCVIALHWFNPVAWIAARRLRAEAEMAADAHALRCTDASEVHRFGEMLLGFSNHAAGWLVGFASAALLGISANPKDLRRRIEGLMDIARGRQTRWVFGMVAFMVMALIGLTRSPAEHVKRAVVNDSAKAAKAAALTNVTGVVVDESDKPVKGAEVRLTINLTARGDQKSQVTGEDGKFRFDSVPQAASMNLRATHADYAESSLAVFQGISQDPERRLVLPKISWVVGKITDKRDGRPIQGAQVFFGIENKFPYSSRFDWRKPFVKTDEAGAYRLPVKVRDAKEIIVRTWAEGMTSQSKLLKIAGHELEFDVALGPVERIPGKVVDAVGEPVKDALVWVVEDAVRLDETQKPITLEMLRSSERVKMTQGRFFISLDYSKEDGAVRLPEADPLLKDKLWVVAMHPKAGFARMRADDLKPGVVFKLEKWASMSGKMIRSDGSPVTNATVTIHARGDADLLPRAETLKIQHDIKVTTDLSGAYKMNHLLPGATFNGVTIDEGRSRNEYLPTAPMTVGSGTQGARQITLGTSLASRAAGGVRSVQGRIVLPEGYAFRGDEFSFHMYITSQGATVAGMPTPDKDGRFITELLPPGIYELRVSVMPRNPRTELSLDAGRWMHFQIEPGDGQAVLRLEDIILNKEDLTPKPLSGNPRASEAPVYGEGPTGKIEITTVDGDKKPLPGAKIEILDLVDHAHAPMNLASALGQHAQIISDKNGNATVSFPRMPVAGRKASGVQVVGSTQKGGRARMIEMMDGKKYDLRIYPETPVALTVSPPIVRWSACSSVGKIAENLLVQDGEVRGRLALGNGTHFVLQGTTAEGKVLYSQAIGAAKDHAEEVKATVTLTPGVEIEGKIEGLPQGDEGTGGVVANVFVRSEGELNEIKKGFPPNIPWTVWAPVGPDGRFHFTGMPRGMVSLTALGKGWITSGLRSSESSTLVNITGPAEKVVVTMSAKPCTRRILRVLLPDGSPAAGATVQVELPGIGLGYYGRGNLLAEDADKHAQFKKAAWTARQTVADDQGQVLLENRPAGRTFCQVFWVDAKTQHPRSGSASFTFEDGEKNAPVEIKLEEK